jgi:hypothetical protein
LAKTKECSTSTEIKEERKYSKANSFYSKGVLKLTSYNIIILWQLQSELYYFLEMLKYSKNTILKEKYFVKEYEMF